MVNIFFLIWGLKKISGGTELINELIFQTTKLLLKSLQIFWGVKKFSLIKNVFGEKSFWGGG